MRKLVLLIWRRPCEVGTAFGAENPAHWRPALEWVLSGLLGVLVYILRAVRKRDAARDTAARLRNLEGEAAAARQCETGAAPDGAGSDDPRRDARQTASLLQPGPRVLRIREEPDR